MGSAGSLVLTLGLASAVARGAAPLEVADVDLVVPAADQAGRRRAPFPSHRVLTGDEARIVATIRVGALRVVRPRITFSTNAPLEGRRDEPRSEGVFVGPAGPRFVAGSVVFTTAGAYKVRVHVDHEGGPQEADATFTIEVGSAPVQTRARTESPTSLPVAEKSPTPARPPAAAPSPTVAPAAGAEAPGSGVFGPDAAMIRRLKVGIRQVATKRACTECPALARRADALGAETDAAAALAEYQALLGELSRIQSK